MSFIEPLNKTRQRRVEVADIKKCEICGKEFEPKNRLQKYCSPKHLAHCEICGKEKEFASGVIYKDKDGKLFSKKACPTKCSVEKSKRTCLEKYGVENGAQAKEVQEKIKKTNLERYGVDFYNQYHITNVDDWLDLSGFLSKIQECMTVWS